MIVTQMLTHRKKPIYRSISPDDSVPTPKNDAWFSYSMIELERNQIGCSSIPSRLRRITHCVPFLREFFNSEVSLIVRAESQTRQEYILSLKSSTLGWFSPLFRSSILSFQATGRRSRSEVHKIPRLKLNRLKSGLWYFFAWSVRIARESQPRGNSLRANYSALYILRRERKVSRPFCGSEYVCVWPEIRMVMTQSVGPRRSDYGDPARNKNRAECKLMMSDWTQWFHHISIPYRHRAVIWTLLTLWLSCHLQRRAFRASQR